jgi:hypothetical protein
MTVIGITNIVFASLGLALALLALAAAALAAGLDVRQMVLEARPETSTLRGLAILSLPVVLFAAMDVLLLLAGIRVLQLSPRARTYSLVWAGLALIGGILDSGWLALHSGGIEILLLPFALVTPAYGILLIVLFRRSQWKRAFAG